MSAACTSRLCAAAVAAALLVTLPASVARAAEEDSPFAASPANAALRPGDQTITATDRPEALREVGFDQKLDQTIPLDVRLRDESGREIRLGDYFGDKPVILSLAYYSCPMLCGLHLQGLASSLKPLRLGAGEDFTVLTVSFDPRDTAELATKKKAETLGRYERAGAEHGWHFLTGDAEQVAALTSAVGFRYQYDAARGEYAHPAGIVILTPEGRVSRYLFGVEYAPRDVRLGLVESAAGKIGNVVDQVLLFCFHYDPAMGRYSMVALNSVRAGGVLTILGILAFVGVSLRREAVRRRAAEPHGTSGS